MPPWVLPRHRTTTGRLATVRIVLDDLSLREIPADKSAGNAARASMAARYRLAVSTLLTRAFTEDEARGVASWSYPAPFDVYNVDPENWRLFLDRTREGEGYYPAVGDNGAVVAFCVFGAEARVRGQAEPRVGTLDVGAGVRPDSTSQGVATGLLGQAIGLSQALFDPRVLRTAVAGFNERSLALCRRAGFRPVRTFPGPGGRPFQELTLTLGR